LITRERLELFDALLGEVHPLVMVNLDEPTAELLKDFPFLDITDPGQFQQLAAGHFCHSDDVMLTIDPNAVPANALGSAPFRATDL
jgi:hypothetical protein